MDYKPTASYRTHVRTAPVSGTAGQATEMRQRDGGTGDQEGSLSFSPLRRWRIHLRHLVIVLATGNESCCKLWHLVESSAMRGGRTCINTTVTMICQLSARGPFFLNPCNH